MSSAAAYSHYVFDLDGTLVDSICGIDASARAALAELAPEASLPSLRSFIGPPIRQMLERALRWSDPTRLDALEVAFRRHYDGGGWRDSPPYPDVANTLHRLHTNGATLFVLTNKPPIPAARIIEHLGWTPLFESIVSPQSSQPPFPNKAAAALDLRDRHRLPATTTLLVGDSADDQEAAHAAGFAFAAARWGYGTAATLAPDRTLDTVAQLLPPPA
jgi:phosphoglycolate phosphatase